MKENALILEQILKARKSTFAKDYTGEDIPEAILEKIVESAEYTPNHKRTTPWRLRVFKGEEKKQLGNVLAEIYKKITLAESFLEKKYLDIPTKFTQSGAVISIVANISGKVAEWEEIAATSMAVQNMYLTATVHNIGCYWGTPGMIHHLQDYLNLEENQKCLGFFFLGITE
ncbi:nitroreductase [Elizabethkingia sp. JS20170427COW]|uniref:nitroreductase family protein n=1 Tax=Elizabethkingia sp. JS20170427COW TaxID=2583851 RepID=UPI001110D829|nr:nitroreductase [Elizabethkingia sp. JS20170427COW]QCX53572.1 nitroreductase [Elizabethkingia sp. JS20170427COW]